MCIRKHPPLRARTSSVSSTLTLVTYHRGSEAVGHHMARLMASSANDSLGPQLGRSYRPGRCLSGSTPRYSLISSLWLGSLRGALLWRNQGLSWWRGDHGCNGRLGPLAFSVPQRNENRSRSPNLLIVESHRSLKGSQRREMRGREMQQYSR